MTTMTTIPMALAWLAFALVVLQVDALPVDALPVDALPVDALPVDVLPVDALPVDVLPVAGDLAFGNQGVGAFGAAVAPAIALATSIVADNADASTPGWTERLAASASWTEAPIVVVIEQHAPDCLAIMLLLFLFVFVCCGRCASGGAAVPMPAEGRVVVVPADGAAERSSTKELNL